MEQLLLTRGWLWGEVKPVKWHEGLVKGWSRDSLLDVIVPTLTCLFFAVLYYYT